MDIKFYNDEKNNHILSIETLKKHIEYHNEKIDLLDKIIQLSLKNIDIEQNITVNKNLINNNINNEEIITDNNIIINCNDYVDSDKNDIDNYEINNEKEELSNIDNKVSENINDTDEFIKSKRYRDEDTNSLISRPLKMHKNNKRDMYTVIFKIFRYIFRNKLELKKNQTNRSFSNFILSKIDEKYYNEKNKLIPYHKKGKCQWANNYECCYAPYTAILKGGLSQYCIIHTDMWIKQFMTLNNCDTLINEYKNIKFNI